MDLNGKQHFTHNEYNFILNNELVDLKEFFCFGLVAEVFL